MALTVILGAVFIALCFTVPLVIDWYYSVFHPGAPNMAKAVIIAFYACSPGVLIAIYNIIRLLNSIRRGSLFTVRNVTRLRMISFSCAYAAAVTLTAGFFYPPLLIISFAAFFLCLIVRVIKNVMAYAVDMKNETELTI